VTGGCYVWQLKAFLGRGSATGMGIASTRC
jgi:hypothetical protein